MTTKSTCLKETQRMRKIPPYPPLQKGGWEDFQVKRFLTLLAAAFCIFISTFAAAQEEGGSDKTLSPYFFVKSDDSGVDQLPLKSTSANVNISGVIADVTVTQVYKNEGKRPLEAIYVFPASTRAAVYGMKMTIGERTINAVIKKREDARKDYEKAKEEGRSASLLEQQRPNVFQMNVANILPGDIIQVELSYTELLVPIDKVYEFAYPTVVGPRYSNQKAETAPASENWIQNPYLHQGESPTYTFDIQVNLSAGLPIQKVFSPSHKVNINYDGPADATIALEKSEQYGGNRDYILRYQLSGEQIESGLLLYKGERENFFLLMLQPPKRVTLSQIPGREYIFIVDVSGSMYGFPLDISKKLLKDLISNLRPNDRFNVLLFAGDSSVLAETSLSANAENISKSIHFIEQQRGGGGTELLPALRRALALPRAEGYSRTVVIATDGYVTVEEQAFDLIRNNLGNANLFAFGIGTSVNRHIIEGMAHVGMGEPFVITKPEEAQAKAEAFRKLIQSPLLTQIRLDFNGFKTYDVEPLSIPDVLADRPVLVFGKWQGSRHGTITLRGTTGDRAFKQTIDISKIKPLKENSALRFLWARHRIMLLSYYNMLRSDDDRVKEVTELGLAYNLLTAYTSFVAIDNEIRNKEGKPTTVNQPLPLPEGVSDYAVGNYAVGKGSGYLSSAPPFTAKRKDEALSETKLGPSVQSEEKPAEIDKNSADRVRLETIVVSNNEFKAATEKAIKGYLEELQKGCAGTSQGRLIIMFTITGSGSVKDVSIVRSELKDKNILQCVLQKIKKWKLPITQGQETKVTVTIAF